jgi:phage gpG-like protein
MNNEPVAWISVLGIDHIGQKFTDVRVSLTKTDVADIPLYTHPAKTLDEQFEQGFKSGKEEGWKAHKFHHPAKTLTDEEIIQVWNAFERTDNIPIVDFARAILRKAQEK